MTSHPPPFRVIPAPMVEQGELSSTRLSVGVVSHKSVRQTVNIYSVGWAASEGSLLLMKAVGLNIKPEPEGTQIKVMLGQGSPR